MEETIDTEVFVLTNEERNQEIEQAYKELDDAVRKLVTLEMTDKGLVTDYLVAVAIQAYDEEGNMMDTVEPILPERGRLTPRYRTLGLLKDLQVQYDAVASATTIRSLGLDGGEED
jgi:hypothetical protein